MAIIIKADKETDFNSENQISKKINRTEET